MWKLERVLSVTHFVACIEQPPQQNTCGWPPPGGGEYRTFAHSRLTSVLTSGEVIATSELMIKKS